VVANGMDGERTKYWNVRVFVDDKIGTLEDPFLSPQNKTTLERADKSGRNISHNQSETTRREGGSDDRTEKEEITVELYMEGFSCWVKSTL